MIRDAAADDAAGVADIWRPVVEETLATFSTHVRTPEEVAWLIGETRAGGRAFLVEEDAAGIAGFAYYFQLRGGPGYSRTMEHTIHVSARARGAGVGRRLMAALEGRARDGGAHSLWAGVSGANPGGVAFHEAVGFVKVAELPRVGWKRGRLLDLILLMKVL